MVYKKEALFVDEISGLSRIIKISDKKAQNTMILKPKFVQNLATLDVTSSSLETMVLYLTEFLGILD